MLSPRMSLFAFAVTTAAAGFGCATDQSVADSAVTRTENVSVQILTTCNNNGELEECG